MDDELLEQRFALVDDRLEHLERRAANLEEAATERKSDNQHEEGMRVNWIVVGLFVFELLQGAVTLVWMVRHG